jgi:pSer/pThr/pTyr-binding forkhead associated (FHA) protein
MKSPPIIIVQIVHLQGPLKDQIQEFSDAVLKIGRHPDCQIRFPADLVIVSRKHAEIAREGNRFKLVDSSTNGTFVNGKRVPECYLKNGDVLTFAEGGPKISFLIQTQECLPTDLAGPPDELSDEPLRQPRFQSEPDEITPVHEPVILVAPASMPLIFQYGPTLRSFKQLPVTIGNHPSCQVRIDHPAVLNRHAQVFFHQNRYWLKDLTGQSLLLINGQMVKTQAPLETNDLVSLSSQGPVFRFLGEGRFAEEEWLPAGDPALPGAAPEQKSSPRSEGDQESPSFFKKLLK